MKIYTKEEIDALINAGHTGDYYIVMHSQDLIKIAHAVAYNAQSGSPNSLAVLTEQWKMAVDKHLVKVFSTYLKQEKIHIIKNKNEEDA